MSVVLRRSGGSFLFGLLLCTSMVGIALAQNAVITPSTGTSPAPNVYDIKIELANDGKIIASPLVQVLHGKPARVTIGDPKNPDGAIRIQALAQPGSKTKNGEPAIDISVIVLEQMAGAWVILGEPRMRVAKGKVASVSVGAVGGMTLSVTVTPKYSERAAKITPKVCGAIDEPLSAAGLTGRNCPNCPSLPCPDCPNCCSSPCADGPGNLTCCGGTSCCGCGTCCDPPL